MNTKQDKNDGVSINPQDDDSLVDRVAEAIYKEHVNQAVREVDKFEFPIDDLDGCFFEAITSTDRACSIASFACIDQMLTATFKYHLAGPERIKKRIIKHTGSSSHVLLNSFSSKLTLAFGLGWMSADTHHDVNLLRSIRNRFAHEMGARSFDDIQVAGLLSSLTINTAALLESIIASSDRLLHYREPLIEIFQPKSKYHFALTSLLLAQNLVIETTTFPVSKAFQVDPKHLLSDWEGSTLIRRIRMEFARVILTMLLRFEESFKRSGHE